MSTDAADSGPPATLLIAGHVPVDLDMPVIIGRDPRTTRGEVLVVDNDPLVSKSHLSIDRAGDGFVITDLGSSNGTFLHHLGRETAVPTDSWIPIPPGAEIEFGDQRMTIEVPVVPGPAVADEAPTPQHGIVASVAPVAPADPWGAGAQADAPMACVNCGRELAAGSRFCDGCGTPTSYASVAPGPAAPPAGPDPNATVVVPAVPIAPSVAPPGPVAPFDAAPAGGPAFVDPAASSRSTGGRWRVVGIVVGAVVVLGLIGAVVVTMLSGDDASEGTAEEPLVPETLDERWSESVRADVSDAYVDNRGVYVVSVDFGSDRVEVVGFDRDTGDELWESTIDAAGSFASFAGGVPEAVLVTVCDDDCSVVGLDAQTGDELWSEQIGDGFPLVIDRFWYSAADGTIEFFDPLTGDRLERVRGDDVRVRGDHIEVSDGDDIEVFDLDLNSVLGPEPVDRADAVAYDGTRLIVAEGDELRFIDTDGTVVKESSVDVGTIDSITPVADDNIVLSSDEGVISIDPLDGTADERWSQRGELVEVVDADGGTVVLVDGGDTIDVIEADSGDRRFTSDLDQPADGFALPGRNLLVIYRLESFDEPRDLSAFDWQTGDELWQERFDGFPVVDGGLVVEVFIDGDVVVYG